MGSTPSESERLNCPNCAYSLTGLSENRCPECGAAFDLEALRRQFSLHPQSWYVNDGPGPTAIEFFFAAAWCPGRLAKSLPLRVDWDQMWRYSAAGYALGMLPVGAILALLVSWGSAASALIVLPLCWSACELSATGVLTGLLRARDGRGGWHYWRRLTHATSGFSSAFGFACGFTPCLFPYSIVVPIALIFGWFACLATMVRSLAGATARSTVAVVLILILGFAWTFGGFMLVNAMLTAFA